jgi:transcriptional regulator with XRE-family HTH domain
VNNFPSNLVYLRKKAGKTQDDIVRELNYSGRGRIANYEGGHSKPSVDDLIKLAQYYKVLIDDLLFKDLSQPTDQLNIAAEPSVNYQTPNDKSAFYNLIVESYEIRLKTQDDIIATLTANNESLNASNQNLMSMLKANYIGKNTPPVEKPVIKKGK